MRERILHGWSEQKCAIHRKNAQEGGFTTRCDREGVCVYTGAPHVNLTFEEYQILLEVYDFVRTGELLSKDI